MAGTTLEINHNITMRPDKTKTAAQCFDDLEATCKRTLAILKERHLHGGLMTWNQLMKDNCLELNICLHNLGIDISGRT